MKSSRMTDGAEAIGGVMVWRMLHGAPAEVRLLRDAADCVFPVTHR
jgi:hypothetical protein